MAKSFKQNPLELLNIPKKEPAKVAPAAEAVKEPEQPKEVPVKKKPGRPTKDPTGKKKKDECKTVNIAIYKELFDKIDIAKAAYNNNLTEYINALILRDLDANLEEYKQLFELSKKFQK